MRQLRSIAQSCGIEIGILVDLDCAVAPIMRRDQAPAVLQLSGGERALFISRRKTEFFRQEPDLQEVNRIALRGVKFRMRNTGTCGHALQLAGPDYCARAQTVLVLKRAVKNPGKDFHVAVRMLAEAGTRCDPILVDHTQGSKTHEARVVIFAERERVPAFEPAKVCRTAILGKPGSMHGNSSPHRIEEL
jgi:hypothetical protein